MIMSTAIQRQPFSTFVALEAAKRMLSVDRVAAEFWEDNGVIRTIYRRMESWDSESALCFKPNSITIRGRWINETFVEAD
jgi:hypothetical protein